MPKFLENPIMKRKKVCLDKTVNVNQFFLTFKLNIRFLSPASLILNKIYLMPCFNEPNQLFLKIPPFFILNFHSILFPLWLVDYRSLDRLSTLDISNNTIVDIGEAFVNMPELKVSKFYLKCSFRYLYIYIKIYSHTKI